MKVKLSKRQKRENLWGYIFISPQIIGLFLFVIFPVVASIYLCFTYWNFIDFPFWVGLKNFTKVFTDKIFYKSILNTLIYIFMTVPLTIFVSLSLALLTNRKLRLLKIYKAAYFLPMITASVSIAMVWFWLYAPEYGIINVALQSIGINNPPNWLVDKDWAKVAIVIMSVWLKMGYYYIIFDAGLKNIPIEYYEAAKIDGASPLKMFYHITLKLLSPVMFFVMIMLFIDTFNMFSEIYVMTRGGPNYSTYTLVMYIYFKAFGGEFNMGEAAVGSMVLFALVGFITFVQFKLSKRWVTNDL